MSVVPLLLASCAAPAPPPAPPAGVAYAGPAALNIRKELGPRSVVVATAKHGDRLGVIETRRRFVKVRTAAGAEGWTDLNLLLSEQQMGDLLQLKVSAAKLPSQGTATVYEPLNIHAEPFRQSPSFFQIPENGLVDVIGHRVSPRDPPAPPKPQRARRTSAPTTKNKAGAFPFPLPAPPPIPPDVDLSRPAAPPAETRAAPLPLDDWFLVRTRTGDVGWALARMLVMAIPDEVAQYAEGHRITAYLPLGEVTDAERNQTKQNWLWTTASFKQEPYEFDSFRVFVFSVKHHRYETAYIERNVQGYYPVEAVSLPGGEKAFSLVLKDKDGRLNRCTYAFGGYRVRLASKEPYRAPPPLPEVRPFTSFAPSPPKAPASLRWTDRLRAWRKSWLGR
ncbi:MAG TPA: SH3 domain-containing protein [Bryobacteraceae bacterium]|nr:SH3 domain-containing protein [Bryobacteraceae bacterium]